MTLRIAVYHDLPSGGAKRALERQVSGLASRGHRIDLYIPSTANEKFLPLAQYAAAVRVIARPPPPDREKALERGPSPSAALAWLRYLAMVRSTERAAAGMISEGRHDVALVAASQFTQAPWLLRWLTVPSVYYCQEPLRAAYEPRITSPQVRLGIRFTLGAVDRRNTRAAGRILVNSNFSRGRIESIYQRKSEVNYLGVDGDRFRPLDVVPGAYLLAIAAMHPLKGLDFIVTSVARVPREQRLPLVVVSDRARDAERMRIESQATAAGVEISFRLGVSEDELVQIYNQAQLVLYAPYDEPFGFVPLEAMACGRPVLGVDEGGIPETIIDNRTGFLSRRDPDEFASRIVQILSNATGTRVIAARGPGYVRERWSWQRSVDELERHCMEMAGVPT
jgi:glycosyltransferase involved in cell wall biosynthesis